MAEDTKGGDGVLVQVCLECGKDYTFEAEEPPAGLTCDKCGGSVFRSFFAAGEAGEAGGASEAAEDFRESTERDTLTTDPGTDISQGDLHDLRNL
jgi:hypothetical protein